MGSSFVLRITAEAALYPKINDILNVKSNSLNTTWELVVNEESDFFPDAIGYLIGILEPNFGKLQEFGITKNDIAIWHYKEFKDECNMEFSSVDLLRLGENEIDLCISCWQLFN